MLWSKGRAIVSAILAIGLVIYALNFVEGNLLILAGRSTGRIVFDYVVNFIIFFIVFYLVLLFLAFVFFGRKK
jgi:hypothetical protein